MNIPNRRESMIMAGVFLLGGLANSVYAAVGVRASSAFQSLYYVAIAWAFAIWIAADAKRLSVDLPFDIGWFVFIAWPVVVPYHLLKTRGIRGIVALLGFAGTFLATYLLSLLLYLVIVALR